MPLAAFELSRRVGYVGLALLIGGESSGVPLPGETALIAAAVLASRGQLDIVLVIVVAAASAIVGDNVGYLAGRAGGRQLVLRGRILRQERARLLASAERFFDRHGAKAVFLGRWFAGLRIAAAWTAGISGMRWPMFLCWNALGGIAWAASVGIGAYVLGSSAEAVFRDAGLAAIAVALAVVLGVVGWRVVRARRSGTSS